MSRFSLVILSGTFLLLFVLLSAPTARPDGSDQDPEFPLPNVIWSIKDSISACPAGDSVIAGHPSQLRIRVEYNDANYDARPDVPPDSIWATFSTVAWNAVANDEGERTYATDTTDANGQTRIIVPSLSGVGTAHAPAGIYLYRIGSATEQRDGKVVVFR